ncbi:MAG: transcriptional regulator [Verrucomicrobia bacterium]|nr:transcriptional regulator [Verrucomicrobiota bacterium]
MASAVVSLRVSDEQAERLQRKARQLGRTPSETGAILLDESLRRDEFAFIDFRDSAVGRQAYIQGSRLAVWQVVSLVRRYAGDVTKACGHLEWPPVKVRAALSYAKAFPEEIENAIRDAQSCSFDRISRMLPQAEEFVVPSEPRKKK